MPAFGLEGAAVATIVGRGLGVVYQLRALAGGNGRVAVDWRRPRLELEILPRLLRVSGIGVVQNLVGSASFVGLIRILAPFGDTVLAGYTVAIRIILFVLLPAWGVGIAAATLVGQNLGAGRPDRAERAVWFTARVNTVFLGLVGLFFFVFARPVVGLLAADAEVAAVAAACLRIVAASYVFWGFGIVTVVAVQRGRRHHHADLDQLLRLLGGAASAGVDPGGAGRGRPCGGVRDGGRLPDADGGGGGARPSGAGRGRRGRCSGRRRGRAGGAVTTVGCPEESRR